MNVFRRPRRRRVYLGEEKKKLGERHNVCDCEWASIVVNLMAQRFEVSPMRVFAHSLGFREKHPMGKAIAGSISHHFLCGVVVFADWVEERGGS